MMRKRLLTSCLVLAIILGSDLRPTPARAFIVFDPTNFSQNVLTAAHTLEQINNQILSLQNEAVMLQNEAKNLQNLNYSSLGQMNSSLTQIGTLMNQADGLSFRRPQARLAWQASQQVLAVLHAPPEAVLRRPQAVLKIAPLHLSNKAPMQVAIKHGQQRAGRQLRR